MKLQFNLLLPHMDLKGKQFKVIKTGEHGIPVGTIVTINSGYARVDNNNLRIDNHDSWGTRTIPLDAVIFTNITKLDLQNINRTFEKQIKFIDSQIKYLESKGLEQLDLTAFYKDHIHTILYSSKSDTAKIDDILSLVRL